MSGTVARAFEIAPDCTTIDEIRAKLKAEGFGSVQEHLQGGSIQKELRKRLGGRSQTFAASPEDRLKKLVKHKPVEKPE